MCYQTLYSLSGTAMLIGGIAALYGIHSLSFTVFIEGLFLLWIGFSITANAMANQRLDSNTLN